MRSHSSGIARRGAVLLALVALVACGGADTDGAAGHATGPVGADAGAVGAAHDSAHAAPATGAALDGAAIDGGGVSTPIALDEATRAARDYEAWLVDGRARAALDAGRPAEALAEIEAFFGGPIGDPVRALPLQLAAYEAARVLARHVDAAAWLDRAEALLAELGPTFEYRGAFELALLQARARTAQDLGRPDEAARHLARANALAAGLGDTRVAAALAVEGANLWLAADEHALLEQHVAQALQGAALAEHADHRGALELCLATSLVVQGRLDGARDGEARALLLDLAQREGLFAGDRERARLRLAELFVRAGEREAAARELEAVALVLDGAEDGARFERGLLALLEARLARERARDLGPDEARAVRRAALERLAAVVDARLAQAHAAPLLADGVGALHVGEERGLLSELVLLAAEEHGAAAALERVAAVHALATRHRRAGRAAPTRLDAEALGLGAGEGLLVYLPAVLQSHLFLVDAQGCELVALPPVGAINRVRRAFDAAFDPRVRRALPAAEARALAAALLPPAAEARLRGWSSASVVGIELVRYAPFELLPLSDGTPLGERVALGYQPDLVTAAWLAPRALAAPAADAPLVAWLGAPPTGADLAPIVLDGELRARLGRGAATGRVFAREGRAATPAALAEAAASGALVLHVLTHGVTHGVPDGSGRGAGLLLCGADGAPTTFGVRDVEALPRVPPIVVLSACRAARGANRLGESGLDGLVGALLERGALVVLLPFEDVELDAATRLVAGLQERFLAGGTSVAQALAEARRDLARTDPALATASLLHAFGRANVQLAPR